jgi:hypothetical protein
MIEPKKISKGKKRALAGARKPEVEEADIDAEEESAGVGNSGMLVAAISSVGVVTVLRSSMNEKQLRLRLRISSQSKWKHMLTFLLREEVRVHGAWNLHVCQHHLLYLDRLVYTWNFVLQSDDLDSATRDVCRMFDLIRSNLSLFEEKEDRVMRPGTTAKPAQRISGELAEYPLMSTSDRNRLTSRGKGASPL